MRRAAKKDANHNPIVADLGLGGIECFDLSAMGGGWPDIVAASPAKGPVWMEFKSRYGKRTPKQEKFRARFPFVIYLVRTTEDGYRACGMLDRYEELRAAGAFQGD